MAPANHVQAVSNGRLGGLARQRKLRQMKATLYKVRCAALEKARKVLAEKRKNGHGNSTKIEKIVSTNGQKNHLMKMAEKKVSNNGFVVIPVNTDTRRTPKKRWVPVLEASFVKLNKLTKASHRTVPQVLDYLISHAKVSQ